MGVFFLAIFILWGWAEMSAFIYLGKEIGGLFTLIGVFLTGAIGILLLKSQGFTVLKQIQNDFITGQAPINSIGESISLATGGLLMLLPGYISDMIGLLLFLPGFRNVAGAWALQYLITLKGVAYFTKRQEPHRHHQTEKDYIYNKEDVIEGEVIEHTFEQKSQKQDKK